MSSSERSWSKRDLRKAVLLTSTSKGRQKKRFGSSGVLRIIEYNGWPTRWAEQRYAETGTEKGAIVYVALSYPHNRLAVHEEVESFSVTQHVFDPSLFHRGGGSPLKHLGPSALRPPTFHTFVSLPTGSMLVDDR